MELSNDNLKKLAEERQYRTQLREEGLSTQQIKEKLDSESDFNSIAQKYLESDFTCPISQDIMRNPIKVIHNDNIYYFDKSYCDIWLKTKNGDLNPLTMCPGFKEAKFIEDNEMKEKIIEYCKSNRYQLDSDNEEIELQPFSDYDQIQDDEQVALRLHHELNGSDSDNDSLPDLISIHGDSDDESGDSDVNNEDDYNNDAEITDSNDLSAANMITSIVNSVFHESNNDRSQTITRIIHLWQQRINNNIMNNDIRNNNTINNNILNNEIFINITNDNTNIMNNDNINSEC